MKPFISSSTQPSLHSAGHPAPASQPPLSAEPINLEEESVAGEEDPGAALDLPTEGPGNATPDNKN
jgi:hypothetical protein